MGVIDLATGETLAFIEASVPNGSRRILEIGCGAGELAAALVNRGYEVVALDSHRDAVKAARAKGVRAIQACWPDWDDDPFDVVLFTRSLHHIHDLRRSVARAAALLREDGVLIVEDFAFADATPWAAAWFQRELRMLDEAPRLDRKRDTFGASLLASEDPMAAWHQDHGHDLHTASAMAAALAHTFESVREAKAPYLYRYLLQMVADDALGSRLVSLFLAQEKALAERLEDFAIGRRWLARKPKKQST